VNYTATPIFVVSGGGATTPAVITGATPTANTSGGLTSIGLGTLTLSGANTYTGNTTISNGILALSGSGSISSTNINVTSGAYFDVSALASYSLNSGQNLEGSGYVNVAQNGLVATASGSGIYPGTDGTIGDLTINGGLTLSSGATANFDLDTTYNGANDQITVYGALTLNGNAIHIKAPSSLDNSGNDYVLITAGSISGSFSSTPVWDVRPANAANFTVVTDPVNNQVRLHYSTLASPAGSGFATPSPAVHSQNVLITVTVTNGSGTVDPNTGVVLNAGTLDGSLSSVPLVLSSTVSSTVHVYTNTITVPALAAVGNYTLSAVITDSYSDVGTANISLAVTTTEVWNGGGSSTNLSWSNNPNWVVGMAPELSGDTLIFAGTVGTAPNMDNNYSVTGLTFSNNAASFTIGSTTGSTLSLAGGITNNSANAQTLNVPITLSAPQTFNAASGNIAISGVIDDSGSGYALTKTGNGALVLSATNTYTGPTLVNAGTLKVSSTGTVKSSGTTTVGNAVGNAVLLNSGSLSQLNVNVGTVSGAVGAIYQNAGDVTATQSGAGNDFQIGSAAGAYGYYYAGGGTLNVNEIGVAGEDAAGNGIMEINGSTVNDAGWFVISRTGSAQAGVLNVFSGSLSFAGGGLIANWGSGQTSIINVLGGSVNSSSAGVGLGSGTSILNLNGGLLSVNRVGSWASWGYQGNNGQVNFNGGTLQASTDSSTFLTPNSATIYSGGATIDNNGHSITIGQPLLAATGNGSASASVTSGGAGYIAPPIITITNAAGDTTGTGATAIAQINRLTGAVTNVIITSPGVNYTATPIFVVSGGGATTPAVITGATPTANTSGGLTSIGTGTLTLTGANTYTGNTTVSAGTLELAQAVLATNSTVSIASGAKLQLDFSTTNIVTAILLNGVAQPSGIYNSNTVPAYITGSGSLIIPSTGPGTFTSTPGIGSFTLNGANVVLTVTDAQAGDAYYLLSSTDLSLPINQWHTVATNVAGASGSFTFTGTNVVTPGDPQQFYILSNTNHNH
jgi:autotransporter-associated beta strand protein